jgi:hypothetical protein
MGFMDFSIQGSDAASDFAYDAAEAVVAVCKRELKNKGNKYNTPGFINVALLIEGMIVLSPEVFVGHEGMEKVATQVFAKLDYLLGELQANKTIWEQQREMLSKGEKIPKKELVEPLSNNDEFSLRRLSQVNKTIRRYIEDCND